MLAQITFCEIVAPGLAREGGKSTRKEENTMRTMGEEIKVKEELESIAAEVLDALRPKHLQIWQVKETLRFAIRLADREQLK